MSSVSFPFIRIADLVRFVLDLSIVDCRLSIDLNRCVAISGIDLAHLLAVNFVNFELYSPQINFGVTNVRMVDSHIEPYPYC